jgi:hypothetical protein
VSGWVGGWGSAGRDRAGTGSGAGVGVRMIRPAAELVEADRHKRQRS